MWKRLRSFVNHYPLFTFILLSYALSWWPWALLYMGFPVAVAPFGPFLAALAVLSMTGGRPAIRTLLMRMIRWRVAARWYLVALGLPIVLGGLATVFVVLLGAPMPSAQQFSAWPELLITFPLLLLVPGLGGAWEEPGWRGYAVHQLERKHSRLWALLPLWSMIVLWHLPLFAVGDILWLDVLNMVGGVIIFNWLYHRSGNSVLLVMIIHAMNNTVSGEFFSPMFTGVYATQQAWMRVLVWGIAALAVLIVDWKWWCEPHTGEIAATEPTLRPT